jgi:5-bromo-4-chloroindolyl phosphate hydrolysis protein
MNKQIILNALREELHRKENNLLYDKAYAAFLWAMSDKSKPVSTELHYNEYKAVKNRIRDTQKKLSNIRKTLKYMKSLVIIRVEDFKA